MSHKRSGVFSGRGARPPTRTSGGGKPHKGRSPKADSTIFRFDQAIRPRGGFFARQRGLHLPRRTAKAAQSNADGGVQGRKHSTFISQYSPCRTRPPEGMLRMGRQDLRRGPALRRGRNPLRAFGFGLAFLYYRRASPYIWPAAGGSGGRSLQYVPAEGSGSIRERREGAAAGTVL